MTYRVVHWGTGNAGRLALRGIIDHPDLELVGLWVHNPDKVGRDAGDLVGVDPVGVTAIDDAGALLEMEADCLCYMGEGAKHTGKSIDVMCRFLEAGRDVVTTSVLQLINPAAAAPELREPVEAACTAGGTTFFCSGADPGFASDLIPITLLGLMDDVRAVHIQEIINYETYDQAVVMRSMYGFGEPLDYVGGLFAGGLTTEYWGGVLAHVAATLGVELEEIRETNESAALDHDVEVAVGLIPAGTTAAVHFEVQGIVNGRPAICVEHYTRMSADAAPQWPRCAAGENGYRIVLEGRPELVCEIVMADEHGADGALIANGMRIVNAIPFVCDAKPGLLGALDTPGVVSRNLKF